MKKEEIRLTYFISRDSGLSIYQFYSVWLHIGNLVWNFDKALNEIAISVGKQD